MKHTKCQKIMKLRETSWETEPIPRAGLSCSVRARPLEGLAGRHSPTSEMTRTKHTDCPQNPAHLRIYKFGQQVDEATLCIYQDKVYALAADGYVHALK